MKKSIFVLLSLFVFAGQLSAQHSSNGKKKSNNRITTSKAVIIGLKGGVDMVSMNYTLSTLSSAKQSLCLRPAGGIFAEFPLSKSFSIGVDAMYQGRGVNMTYYDHGDERYPVNYKISSNYFDLRIPFTFRFIPEKLVNPYIFVAPDFSLLGGGKISLDQTASPYGNSGLKETIDIGDANMKSYSISAIAGVGARFNLNFKQFALVIKIDAAYNFGFVNTYSDKEMNHDFGNQPYNENIVNLNAYKEVGKRYNRGVEFMISVGLPLKFMRDACSGFGKRGGKMDSY